MNNPIETMKKDYASVDAISEKHSMNLPDEFCTDLLKWKNECIEEALNDIKMSGVEFGVMFQNVKSNASDAVLDSAMHKKDGPKINSDLFFSLHSTLKHFLKDFIDWDKKAK